MTYEEALRKAVKLLRLTQSSNEHESALAAARAQEIIDRYKIEAASLNMDGPSAEPDEPIQDFGTDPLEKGRRIPSWKWRLIIHLAKVNGCKSYLQSGFGISIIGRASDVTTVRYLYGWLRQEVERLAARDCKGHGAIYKNNFRYGVIDTIGNRLKEQQKQTFESVRKEVGDAPNSSLALIRVNQAIVSIQKRVQEAQAYADTHLSLRSVAVGHGQAHDDARQRGRIAGKEVRFTKAKASIGA